MANQFDRGMDDCYSGKNLPKDPSLEYLRGWGYAESLYEEPEQQSEQVQEDDREQQRE